MSSNMIDKNLWNIINIDIESYNVLDNTKVETIRPLYKKKSRKELENYRPLSLSNAFTKIYERYVLNSITPFVHNFLSIFKKLETYSSNHV